MRKVGHESNLPSIVRLEKSEFWQNYNVCASDPERNILHDGSRESYAKQIVTKVMTVPEYASKRSNTEIQKKSI